MSRELLKWWAEVRYYYCYCYVPAGAARQEGPTSTFSLQLLPGLAKLPWPQGGGSLGQMPGTHPPGSAARGHRVPMVAKSSSKVSRELRGFPIPPPPPDMQLRCCCGAVHMGCRTKDVSKHLRCHQESSPRGLGLPPRCLPCFQAPCLCLLTSQKSLCASVMPVLHQRLTHTCFGCTLARAARLSSPKLLLIVAPVQRGCKG